MTMLLLIDYNGLAQTIVAIGALVASVTAALIAWSGRKSAVHAEKQAQEARDQSVQTHTAVNSRMDEMIKLVKADAAAKATIAEQDAQRLREKVIAEATLLEKQAEHERRSQMNLALLASPAPAPIDAIQVAAAAARKLLEDAAQTAAKLIAEAAVTAKEKEKI